MVGWARSTDELQLKAIEQVNFQQDSWGGYSISAGSMCMAPVLTDRSDTCSRWPAFGFLKATRRRGQPIQANDWLTEG